MKEVLRIPKFELANKLAMIKDIVPSRTPQAVLQSVLVENGYLIANNLQTGAKVKLEAMETEPFLIPKEAFNIIGKYPAGELVISKDDKSIMIKAGSIKNKWQTLSADEFPRIQDTDGESTSIPAEDFIKAVQRVLFATGSGQNMDCLNLKATTGTLRYIALDGHRIARDRADFIGEFDLLIPKNAVEQILSMGLEGELEITFNPNSAVFKTDGCTVTTRLIDGKSYDTDKMLSNEPPYTTAVNREMLLGSLQRAKLCEPSGENVPVNFTFENGTMAIDLNSVRSQYHEELPLEVNIQEPVKIAFNHKLLIDFLKVLDKDNVFLGLTSPTAPMIITQDRDVYQGLVLPVRVKGAS